MKHVTADVMFIQIENRRSLIQPILDYTHKKEERHRSLHTENCRACMRSIKQQM